MKSKAEPALLRDRQFAPKAFVSPRNFGNFLQNSGRVLIFIENDNRCFRVPPSRIRQKLINRFGKFLFPFPKLTFGDEDIFVVLPNQNVCLAGTIECFARSFSFVKTIQWYEQI